MTINFLCFRFLLMIFRSGFLEVFSLCVARGLRYDKNCWFMTGFISWISMEMSWSLQILRIFLCGNNFSDYDMAKKFVFDFRELMWACCSGRKIRWIWDFWAPFSTFCSEICTKHFLELCKEFIEFVKIWMKWKFRGNF